MFNRLLKWMASNFAQHIRESFRSWFSFDDLAYTILKLLGSRHAKTVFMRMRTAKAHIRLRAVWSGPSLSTHWILQNIWIVNKGPDYTFRMRMMIWIWDFAHVRRHFCACMAHNVCGTDSVLHRHWQHSYLNSLVRVPLFTCSRLIILPGLWNVERNAAKTARNHVL